MAAVGRQVAGIVAGIILCMVIIMAVEKAGHALFSGEALFAAPVVAYLVAVTVGSITAIKVAGVRRWWLPGILVAVLAAGTIMNLTMIEHPVWFAPAAAIALIASYAIAWRLTRAV
ncbi:MAG: hypothetical protein JHC88_01070 [Niveispirillum sp.]|nr:hypothetical protein [Niveispirillum sp.]